MGNEASRAILPIPDRPYGGVTTYDAKDPGHVVSADRTDPRAGRGAERARHPHR